MTINLTELRDEPLGKHPSQAAACVIFCYLCHTTDPQHYVVAADDESSFTFDVEGLGDEALDDSPSVSADSCLPGSCLCYADGLGDEALDPGYSVSARVLTCSCGACNQA